MFLTTPILCIFMVISKTPPAAVGHYNILEELGAGSFARVYRCEHMCSGETFAGKLYEVNFAISEDGCKLLRKEISIMKLLRHPHVIRFQEVVSNSKWMLIVMELVEGRTLLDVMPPSGGLPESFARLVMKQILDAAVFLHCNGIVHRDIKLENIMIENDGSVKIIDFGLADHVPKEHMRKGLLIDGRCGSPHYYSPEMILAREGNMFSGDKVDIWAIGILLYALVTGFHPFSAEDNDKASLYAKILGNDVPFESDMSEALENLLRKMLVKDPSERATLNEIRKHAWTNDTFLTPAVDVVLSGDTESLRSKQALSFQNECFDMRAALMPSKVISSSYSIDRKWKGISEIDNHKGHGRNEKPLPNTSSDKQSSIIELKLWKHMKERVKGLINHCKKRTLSRKKMMSISEKMDFSALAVEDDYHRLISATGNRHFSNSFASKHPLKRKRSETGNGDRPGGERICKISFACWINV